jgi:hypothetical protein
LPVSSAAPTVSLRSCSLPRGKYLTRTQTLRSISRAGPPKPEPGWGRPWHTSFPVPVSKRAYYLAYIMSPNVQLPLKRSFPWLPLLSPFPLYSLMLYSLFRSSFPYIFLPYFIPLNVILFLSPPPLHPLFRTSSHQTYILKGSDDGV